MKKLIAVLLVLVMVLTVCACGSSAPAPTPTPIIIYVTPEPTQAPPTPLPVVTPAPTPTPAPSATPRPAPTPVPVTPPVITKDPTDEYITEGGNAYFVAYAENYNYVTWNLVSPDHRQSYNVNNAPWYFSGLSVQGSDTTQLVLCNCPLSLDGWCVEATFTGVGGSDTTDHAYVNVKAAPRTQLWAYPSAGTFQGQDVWIQLNADPGDMIHYEITTDNAGNYSDTIESGGYAILPAVNMLRYNASLYAYVVGDEGNAITCYYTVSNIVLPPQQEDPEFIDPVYPTPTPHPFIPGVLGSSN